MFDQNEVLMFDNRNLSFAKIISSSESECQLLSFEVSSSPIFSRKAKIILNISNRENRTSINIEAKLVSVSRKDGKWIYKAKWEKLPTFE